MYSLYRTFVPYVTFAARPVPTDGALPVASAVYTVIGVPFSTVRFLGVFCWRTYAAMDIFFIRHLLKVIRIDAAGISAKVVDDQAGV
jgi:hypothetical protein